jgi:pilus assembly protein CpaB
MKNRALIPLVIGLVVGLIAVKYSVDVVKRARAASSSEDMTRVVVAQQSIPMGVEIKANMLTISKTSKSLAPQGGFGDPSKLTGRVVRVQIPKGVPVIEEMLAAPGTPAGMASLVPAGYRAVAVKVDEFSSVGGFLKPGCRVDVAAVLSVKGQMGGSQTISRVILQDVTVGAVGQSLTGEGDTGAANISRSVTLLVKPEEVPLLHLAATQGQIRLALRHYEDGVSGSGSFATENQLAPEEPKEKESLLSGLAKLFQSKPAGPAPKPDWAVQSQDKGKPVTVKYPHVMTVISGNSVQTLGFKDSSSTVRVDPKEPIKADSATAMAPAGQGHSTGTVGVGGSSNEPAQQEPAEQEEIAPAARGQ